MSTASRLFYKAAATCRLARVGRSWSRDAVVFGFHNVTERQSPGLGDHSLHLDLRTFTSVVEWIASALVVVPLSEPVARAEAGQSLKKLAAITFDDAYQGVFTHAVPLLRRTGLPATIFPVSSAGESPSFFWWDVLAERGLLSSQTRELCLEGYRGDGTYILEAIPGGREPRLPPDLLPASWEVVRAAAGEGISFGSHTRTHRNLAALRGAELVRELTVSRSEIAAQLGEAPDLIAYPYGRHDATVLREAARAGYRGGVTTVYGTVSLGTPLLGLPRVNVPAGMTVEALECWASGIRLRRSA